MFENDWSKVGIIVLAYVLGLYIQRRDTDAVNKRIDDLRIDMFKILDLIRDDIKELKIDMKELLKVKH